MFLERLRRPRASATVASVGPLVVGCALLGTFAAARTAHADGDDHTSAQQLVADLERARPPAAAGAIRAAKDALERAVRFRSSGDESHAKAADGLAREWAETGRDLALAAAAEEQAADRRRKATDARAKLERTRAFVEEGVARLGRMRAELDAASPAHPVVPEVHAVPPAVKGVKP